jgi:hypothetical protein
MKFIERINGYWLQEVAVQLEQEGKDGRKVLADAIQNLSRDIIEKLLTKRALLRGNSVDGVKVDENWRE